MINLIKFIWFFLTANKYVLRILLKLMEGANELIQKSLKEGQPMMREIYLDDPENKKTFAFWFGEYYDGPLERIAELSRERNMWKEKYFELRTRMRHD